MSSRFRDQVPLWASFYFFQLLVYAFLIFYTKKNNVFWPLGYIFFSKIVRFPTLMKIDISQLFTKKVEFLILKNPKNVNLLKSLNWIDKTWIFVSAS